MGQNGSGCFMLLMFLSCSILRFMFIYSYTKSNYVSIGEVIPITIKIATKIIKWAF
jgi:hypothetical protein